MIGSSICSIARGFRKFLRIVDLEHVAVCRCHSIADTRRSRDQVDLKFALEPFLYDLQVQKP